MSGDLSTTSAADLCRELAGRGATGALELDGPDGPGRVVFVGGHMVSASSPSPRARLGDRVVGAGLLDDASLEQALRLQSESPGHRRLGALLVDQGLVSRDAVRLFVQEQLFDALFDILHWRYGTYRFVEGPPSEVAEVPLSIAVDQVMVEISRRQREWEELRQVIPGLEAIPTFHSEGSSATASLEPDEFAVLASVDGARSIRELASDLGYSEFEAARIVYGLTLLGVVEIRLPEDEVGAALDDAFSYLSSAPDRAPEGDGQERDAIEERWADQPPSADEPAPGTPAHGQPSPPPAPTAPPPAAAGTEGPPDGTPTVAEPAEPQPVEPEPAPAEPQPPAKEPATPEPVAGAPAEPEPFVHPGPDAPEEPEPFVHPGPDAPEEPEPFVHPGPGAPEEPEPFVHPGPGADDEGTVIEADLPTVPPEDFGEVLTPQEEHAPPIATEQPAMEPTPRADHREVSEFLRELSRLALDDAPQQAPPRPPAAPRSEPERRRDDSGDDDEGKRKRRGLFGR